MAQLKGKGTVHTASSGQKSALVTWRVEIESTIPWVGGWRGAWVDGEWKGGRKQRSLGASREGRAEDVHVVRTGAPLRGDFLASWGEGAEAPPPRPPGTGASAIS